MKWIRQVVRTDTNVNVTGLDRVGNLGDGGETGGTLSVDSVDGCAVDQQEVLMRWWFISLAQPRDCASTKLETENTYV
jgi:hypothetical protein